MTVPKLAFGYGGAEELDAGGNRLFANEYMLWWNNSPADQSTLFPSFIELSDTLYQEIVQHAFPCDMRILRELKQSSLALDLYAFATHKVFSMKSTTAISWKGMHAQFGSDYGCVADFRKEALKHLRTIAALYPDFKYTLERGRIIIWPSTTSVIALPPKR